MKTCTNCGHAKPGTKEFFPYCRDTRDKLHSWCRSCTRAAIKDCHQRQRVLALEHYSGGRAYCACCGETRYEFLTLDHVNGGGAAHRREVGRRIWVWLRRNGYPEGFRVLCMNCNFSLGKRGYCPHDRERKMLLGIQPALAE